MSKMVIGFVIAATVSICSGYTIEQIDALNRVDLTFKDHMQTSFPTLSGAYVRPVSVQAAARSPLMQPPQYATSSPTYGRSPPNARCNLIEHTFKTLGYNSKC
jgi:hypothetical protein